jgi:hypothetical protein
MLFIDNNPKIIKALAKVTSVLPLHLWTWQLHECFRTIPIWNLKRYSGFSQLPLFVSHYHYSTLPTPLLTGKNAEKARAGQAMVTIYIIPNKGIFNVNFDTLPTTWLSNIDIEDSEAIVYVYKLFDTPKEATYLDCWYNIPWVNNDAIQGEFIDTEIAAMKVWFKYFDLSAFASNPNSLYKELKPLLV